MQEAGNSEVGTEIEGSELDLILAFRGCEAHTHDDSMGVREDSCGRDPHIRFGRYVRYRPEAINAWIAAQER